MHDIFKDFLEDYSEKLIEKWETFDTAWGNPVKLWHSTSVSEFRSFLQNALSSGIKGLRLIIADGIYLAARASDLSHDNIMEIAAANYLLNIPINSEWSTAGFPKLTDFDFDNFENELEDEDLDFSIEDITSHMLVADCGTFEVALYNFYSSEFIARSNDEESFKNLQLFETSETYKALKPLIKRLYMTSIN